MYLSLDHCTVLHFIGVLTVYLLVLVLINGRSGLEIFGGVLSGLLGKKKYFLDVTVWSQATEHIVTMTWGGLGNATTPIVTVMVASVQDKKVKKDVPDHKCFIMLLMT
ncbi:hypothetical protein B0H10DRAFT_1952383 [Mycena sp. CBHHK59/15]|nr:hypothetical protein B0H10DRAFT_1952383 [Mycena sp. CBHHK59/15]